jgi:hypothetical protein
MYLTLDIQHDKNVSSNVDHNFTCICMLWTVFLYD